MINPEVFNDYVITIDLDWAPDFAIRYAANILIKKRVKATWFITHDSPAVRELFNYPDLFEIGIHPNFMPGSTQGKTYKEILNNLLKIAPNAKSVRMHGLFQSSDILRMLTVDFNLKNDVSIFLWQTPYIIPTYLKFSNEKMLVRVPYLWAEQEEMIRKDAFILENRFLNWIGLKVFSFHPIYVYLNASSTKSYEEIKRKYPYPLCNKKDISSYVHGSKGVYKFFIQLIDQTLEVNNPPKTISEVADKFLEFKRTEL